MWKNSSHSYTALMSIYFKEDDEYLQKSLMSILKQTIKPTEIILVEDGNFSSQLSQVIKWFVGECSKNNIDTIILKHEKAMGLAQSLNEGIDQSNTDFIARFDSDDISLPNRMFEQMPYFENPRVGAVGSNVREFSEKDGLLHSKKVPSDFSDIRRFMRYRNPVNHMSAVIRKSALKTVGCYDVLPFFEDYILWAKLVKNDFLILNVDNELVDARTEEDFVNRRRGIKYAIAEADLQKRLWKLGIISSPELVRNTIFRAAVRLVPKGILRFVYGVMRKSTL